MDSARTFLITVLDFINKLCSGRHAVLTALQPMCLQSRLIANDRRGVVKVVIFLTARTECICKYTANTIA